MNTGEQLVNWSSGWVCYRFFNQIGEDTGIQQLKKEKLWTLHKITWNNGGMINKIITINKKINKMNNSLVFQYLLP